MNIKALNAQMRKDYHAAGYTGKNIIFAVLDTGAEPVGRLRGKVIKRMGDEPRSDHGTFVASIVNEYCPDAEIWSYRCDYPSDIISALNDVTAQVAVTGKRIIANMSLETDNANIKDAVDACVAAGIPLVCAAGNDGGEVLNRYPTCFESPITVAALQVDGKRVYFSTWHNEVDFADFGQWVDGLDMDGNTVTKSGTSFAAPQLAGKIGLLLSARPNMTEPEVYEALKGMAVDLGNKGRDPYTGYGFVQLSEQKQKENQKGEDNMLTEFIKHLNMQVGQPYVWGGQHLRLTLGDYVRLIGRREENASNEKKAIAFCNKLFAAGASELFAYDCSGLGMYWLQNVKGLYQNDMSANGMMGKCTIVKDKPKRGYWVFRLSGSRASHIGYMVDDEHVIHAKGRSYGVVKEKYSALYWHRIGIPKIFASEITETDYTFTRVLKYGCRGEDVKELKKLLVSNGYTGVTVTNGNYYGTTRTVVKAYQRDHGLTIDGKAGKNTITALGGVWNG